jgi:hypothetical protein
LEAGRLAEPDVNDHADGGDGMDSATPGGDRFARREGHRSSALCHIGNISQRLGHPERVKDIARRLDESKLDAEVGRTFERMVSHPRDNGIDLERNKLCVGLLLRIDSEREAFSGHPDVNALLTRAYRRPFVVRRGEAKRRFHLPGRVGPDHHIFAAAPRIPSRHRHRPRAPSSPRSPDRADR